MKDIRGAAAFNMWSISLGTLVLAFVVVLPLYAKSLTGIQNIQKSGPSAEESSADGLPIGEGTVVVMVYTITIPESTLLIPSHFVQFSPGDNELLPNLEVAITGMKQGETKRVELSSEEAFGPYDAAKQLEVSKDRLPQDAEPGMVLTTEDGTPCILVAVSETMATIDFNHPLAGKRVVIDVRILDVTIPPADEQDMRPDDVARAPLRV